VIRQDRVSSSAIRYPLSAIRYPLSAIRYPLSKMTKKIKRRSVRGATAVTAPVTEQLRSYATRGVFREFAVSDRTISSAEYRLVWLTSKPMRARYDAKSSLFTLVDLLPDVAPRSAMDRALREFIAARFSPKLPTHRRISRKSVPKLVCVNRRRKISLRLTLTRKTPAEGARQALLLVSEVFQNFLAGPYHEYMVRNFDLRED
jgi:hypothetical protein